MTKTAIYLRVSTSQQDSGLQEKECRELAARRGYEVEGVYIEELSGFKDIERPKYDLIKNKARNAEINAVIVWALDRWVRNRDTLLEDVSILKSYGCKLHSVKESWLEAINLEGSLGRTIQDFLLGLMGSLGEMESRRKSERVRLAVKRDQGVTVSYKGNRWGRKPLSKEVNDAILKLNSEGLSIRKISKQVFYWDRNNNKHFVSTAYVHKLLKNSLVSQNIVNEGGN